MIVEIIAKYLNSNKRLVVPQLGTFIVKVAGESIIFSNLMKGDDGVLRGLLIEAGMSELEAAAAIDRFLFEVNYRLQNQGDCPLNGFGVLRSGANGSVSFSYAPETVGEKLDDITPKRAKKVEQKPSAEPKTGEAAASAQGVSDGAEQTARKDKKEERSEAQSGVKSLEEPSQGKAEQSKPSVAELQYEEPSVDAKHDADAELEDSSKSVSQERARKKDSSIYEKEPSVSVSAKMRPASYVKGLRYGKGDKDVSGRSYAVTGRKSNKGDKIMIVAIVAAVLATLALAYGFWCDYRATSFDAEIYGEVSESAEATVRNPDLDYIVEPAK